MPTPTRQKSKQGRRRAARGGKSPSPLTYPGGKARILKVLLRRIPPSLSELVAPFIGGGALELTLARQGVRVIAYDAWDHLVNFWQQYLRDPKAIAKRVRRHGPPVGKNTHLRFRAELTRKPDRRVSETERAARFYVVNRNCWGGLMIRGSAGGGHARLTRAAIERLATAKPPRKLSVESLPFEESIPRHADSFLFCDPPYVGCEGVYGDPKPEFDHELLAKLLTSRQAPWLLTYGDHPLIHELYATAGVRIVPIVYQGNVRGCKKDGRRDLIIAGQPR